jgi:hypothetical protein
MGNLVKSAELRQKPNTAEYILRTVNYQISQSGNINTSAQTTASGKKWVRAAKMLGSGDVFLYAWDVRTAESLVHWKADWIGCLGEEARIQLPSYGVIISDVTIADTQMQNQAAMIERFWTENAYLPTRGEITRIRWLGKQKIGKSTNAMVVEFEDPKVANGLLMTGTATWGGQPKKTQRYNRECIVTQCFKCHQYGHLSKGCKSKEVCGYCASKEHNTKDHPDPKNKSVLKCPLCGGKHTAWAGVCPKRKIILNNIAQAKKELLEFPYFPEQVAITPGISGRTTREHSDNGRPAQPREPTEEVIEVEMREGDKETEEERIEEVGGNTLTVPGDTANLRLNLPSSQDNSRFNSSLEGLDASIFNPINQCPKTPRTRARGSRRGAGAIQETDTLRPLPTTGLEESIFNFSSRIPPQTPSTRTFQDRVEASSPITQHTRLCHHHVAKRSLDRNGRQ